MATNIPTPSRLLSLPPELRTVIYTYVFTNTRTQHSIPRMI